MALPGLAWVNIIVPDGPTVPLLYKEGRRGGLPHQMVRWRDDLHLQSSSSAQAFNPLPHLSPPLTKGRNHKRPSSGKNSVVQGYPRKTRKRPFYYHLRTTLSWKTFPWFPKSNVMFTFITLKRCNCKNASGITAVVEEGYQSYGNCP
jgi:hypothetical protein